MKYREALCPSVACEPGAVLLGVVNETGRVELVTELNARDDTLVQLASRAHAPEKQFRFTGPCAAAGCIQWNGDRCGVADRVIARSGAEPVAEAASEPLPACPIRAECRWFMQNGAAACRVCLGVITDGR